MIVVKQFGVIKIQEKNITKVFDKLTDNQKSKIKYCVINMEQYNEKILKENLLNCNFYYDLSNQME